MESENRFELWEDEKEASKDVHQREEPCEDLLHLAESAPLEESEAV
jgi:hypothetical protein